MRELRRKVLLPVFQLSEVTEEGDPRALKRVIKQGRGHPALTYQYRFAWDDDVGRGFNYNLFPVVLDRNGAPWLLGSLYILAKLEAKETPDMSTYKGMAEDLGIYKEWLDTQDHSDDLIFQFPKIKLRRPTYRFNGHLNQRIQAGEMGSRTMQRCMATVVAFYTWLIDNNYFQPEYPPWEEEHYRLTFKTSDGRELSKKVVSTDLRIRAPKSADPFDGTIQDGGKLRPLTGKEQDWILEATKAKRNTECYLIQLFMLATGARIETACTLRLRHFELPNPPYSKALTGDGEVFKLKAGPGTGIDTKFGKNGVLHVPRDVYVLFHTYATSERSNVRRSRFLAKHGEHPDPCLFLTQQGTPYYTDKAERRRFNPDLDRRYERTGQPLRQFLKDHAIPYVREHYDKNFHYRPHYLRASFGMNMNERLMELVQKGTITLSRLRMILKELLWHESFTVTDRYLNYRSQMGAVYEAVNGYGEQLQKWIAQAMNGMDVTDE